MDLRYHQRQAHHSHEEGTSSNEWSDGEFDDEDEDDDIYDFPEEDQLNAVERNNDDNEDDDNDDEDGEIYDTPEDAMSMLALRQQENPHERAPPTISRENRPVLAASTNELNSQHNRNNQSSITQHPQHYQSLEAEQREKALELYDAPPSPTKIPRQSAKDIPNQKPNPKPRPKPETLPKHQFSETNRQKPNNTVNGKRNMVSGRWPPNHNNNDDDCMEEESKSLKENENSPHQKIIDKLSRVINTNAASVRNDRFSESRKIQPPIRGDGGVEARNTSPGLRDKKDSGQFNSVQKPMRFGARPFEPAAGRERPVPEMPSRLDREKGHPFAGNQNSTVNKMANDISSSTANSTQSPVEQETYEVPSPAAATQEPRIQSMEPARDRYQQRSLQAKPVRDFAVPARGGSERHQDREFAPTPQRSPAALPSSMNTVDQESYEVPQPAAPPSSMNTVDQESYEVPQCEPGRPPRRPPKLGPTQERPVPSRPPKDLPQSTRNEGGGLTMRMNPRDIPSRGCDFDIKSRHTIAFNEPETYEVAASVGSGGQEEYEVPHQDPHMQLGRPPVSASAQRVFGPGQQSVSGHRQSDRVPPRDFHAAQQQNSPYSANREIFPNNVPEEYEVPSSSTVSDCQETYEVIEEQPSRATSRLPAMDGIQTRPMPPRPPKDVGPSQRPMPGILNTESPRNNLRPKERGQSTSPGQQLNCFDPGSNQVTTFEEPENYEVASTIITQEDYEVPQHEIGRQHEQPYMPGQLSPSGSCLSKARFDASEAPPKLPPGRPMTMTRNTESANATSDFNTDENYEAMDTSPAIPPMSGRPNSLAVEKRTNRQTTFQNQLTPNDEKSAAKSRASPQGSSPFAAVKRELDKRNSIKGRPLPSDNGRCPPEGQENARITSPMDKILNNVISGLENPSASSSAPNVPRRIEKEQKSTSKSSRPSSLKRNPAKPASNQEISQDAPLLDIADLHKALDAKSEQAVAKPGRRAVPLPEIPPQKTAEQLLNEKAWFKANMDRVEAETVLKNIRKNGAFIVRNTTKIVGYSISIYYDGDIRHLQIPKKNGKFHLGTSNQQFDSVVDLIKYFMSNKIELKAGGRTTLIDVVP